MLLSGFKDVQEHNNLRSLLGTLITFRSVKPTLVELYYDWGGKYKSASSLNTRFLQFVSS